MDTIAHKMGFSPGRSTNPSSRYKISTSGTSRGTDGEHTFPFGFTHLESLDSFGLHSHHFFFLLRH
jgi:hypothetical protein